jgi:hypothetical protein
MVDIIDDNVIQKVETYTNADGALVECYVKEFSDDDTLIHIFSHIESVLNNALLFYRRKEEVLENPPDRVGGKLIIYVFFTYQGNWYYLTNWFMDIGDQWYKGYTLNKVPQSFVDEGTGKPEDYVGIINYPETKTNVGGDNDDKQNIGLMVPITNEGDKPHCQNVRLADCLLNETLIRLGIIPTGDSD